MTASFRAGVVGKLHSAISYDGGGDMFVAIELAILVFNSPADSTPTNWSGWASFSDTPTISNPPNACANAATVQRAESTHCALKSSTKLSRGLFWIGSDIRVNVSIAWKTSELLRREKSSLNRSAAIC